MIASRRVILTSRGIGRIAGLFCAFLMLTGAAGFLAGAEEFSWMETAGGPGELVEEDFVSPASHAMGLAWDGQCLWVSDRREDRLYRIDPQSGATVATLPSPGYQPTGLAWDGQYLWNADQEEGRLYCIDPGSGLTVREVEAPWPDPTGLAWNDGRLWVADGRKDILCLVDPGDGTTIVSFPAPDEATQGLAFDGDMLWCNDRISDRIYGVDPEGGDVLITLYSPGPYPTGLAAVAPGELWTADYQTDRLSRLHARPDRATVLLDEERHAKIQVTTDVLNFGPDPMVDLDVYLAVPGDRVGQRILSGPVFTPQATNSLEDQWGQPVAHFRFSDLGGGLSRRVVMDVEAKISRVRYLIFPHLVGRLSDIPEEINRLYLADSAKYDIHSPAIRAIVKDLVREEDNPYWIARRIFRYLVDHLEYELAGGWNTAPAVLDRGNGSCSEYTFCFIALCRAAGLPARYAGSVVVRGDDASYDDVFHRWAEVYLPGPGWIPVDPSGGDRELPAEQAAYFGELSNRFLITTHGGGDSEYLDWDYNGRQRWTTRGKARIRTETVADWEPVTPTAADGTTASASDDQCKPPS